ncbi:cytokine-dependent hematopoietic cell linker [Neoarius graeffei]|uniref:cytokine-dependent hematopoietic cell linker n=1 Tax=Neoarius graeffei TaxID=443677 RepID=UPI00298C1EB9|nr:cytokine-dependent hematopoietic cell linker [Neoarius graeffei]XP_060757231.1 cytokine-dependent hematopoietic cell linker [Neoarius graeffei]
MDRWNRGGGIKQRSGHQNDSDEGDYHEPEEPIMRFPRPPQSHSEYADKCPVREKPFLGGHKDFKNILDIPPRLPKRPPGSAAPIINRDLKPGRQKKVTSERRSQTLGSNETTTKIPPRPVKSLPRDCFDHHDDAPPSRSPPCAPVRTLNIHTRTAADSGASQPESESVNNNRLTGLRSGSSHRHSLDLESHEQDRSYFTERTAVHDSFRHMHHEWPQVKADTEQASYTGHSKPVEATAEKEWYVGGFSRVEAEHALHLVNREGAFLVRDCSKHTKQEPFVLAIFYNNRVFNVQIRFCEETCKYSLGTRIKTDDAFDSVAEIIKFHSIFPILLIDGRNPSAAVTQKRQCVLMYPVTAEDMRQLLN